MDKETKLKNNSYQNLDLEKKVKAIKGQSRNGDYEHIISKLYGDDEDEVYEFGHK